VKLKTLKYKFLKSEKLLAMNGKKLQKLAKSPFKNIFKNLKDKIEEHKMFKKNRL